MLAPLRRTSSLARKLAAATLAVAVIAYGLLYVPPAAADPDSSGETPSADAPLLEEKAKLNKLISEQSVLMSAYRCRFNVDIQYVPGGCRDGQPAYPEWTSFTFIGSYRNMDLMKLEDLVTGQEALLNAYRCRFRVDTDAVPGGCGQADDTDDSDDGDDPGDAEDTGDVGDSVPQDGWNPFDGFEFNHPGLDRPRQVGVFTESITGTRLSEGARAELRVACFYFDSEEEATLGAYVNWNTFITSRIGIYDLEMEFSGGQSTTFDAVNSTINEASVPFGAENSARFAQSIADSDGETVTASVFIPFGGWTISATFDLSESATAIQPTIDRCQG